MSAWGPNGLPSGVNLGGAIGGGFVQPERLPELNHHDYYRGSLEWGYQPPSRLASAFTPSHEVMLRSDLLEIVPKPEPLWKTHFAALREDPDPQFTLTGVIKSKPTRTWEQKDPELAMLDYLESQIRERNDQIVMRALAGLARSRSGR